MRLKIGTLLELQSPDTYITGLSKNQVLELWLNKEPIVFLKSNGGTMLLIAIPACMTICWIHKDHFKMPPEKAFTSEPLEKESVDMVNHPPHYLDLGMEVKDIIKEVVTYTFGSRAYKAYCLGNELKYRLRAGHKGDAVQDLEKAAFYREERYKS
jgi:hypothetical protein